MNLPILQVREYRKHIEKDAALERRFAPIEVAEPSAENAILILQALAPRYEAHHGLRWAPHHTPPSLTRTLSVSQPTRLRRAGTRRRRCARR
jgi:hypothetical protein